MCPWIQSLSWEVWTAYKTNLLTSMFLDNGMKPENLDKTQ